MSVKSIKVFFCGEYSHSFSDQPHNKEYLEHMVADLLDSQNDTTEYTYRDGTPVRRSDYPDIKPERAADPYPYTESAYNGDYSPSCPWNAPGMCVSDFI